MVYGQRSQGRLGALRDPMPFFPAMNILSLHSIFPAWPNASPNLPDPFQPSFTVAHPLQLYLWSVATDLYFVSKKRRKKLILPSSWGKQNSILSHGAEKKLCTGFEIKSN